MSMMKLRVTVADLGEDREAVVAYVSEADGQVSIESLVQHPDEQLGYKVVAGGIAAMMHAATHLDQDKVAIEVERYAEALTGEPAEQLAAA